MFYLDVDLSLMVTFNKLNKLTTDLKLISKAVKNSKLLQVMNTENTRRWNATAVPSQKSLNSGLYGKMWEKKVEIYCSCGFAQLTLCLWVCMTLAYSLKRLKDEFHCFKFTVIANC